MTWPQFKGSWTMFQELFTDGQNINPFPVVRDAVVGRIDQSCLHTVTSIPEELPLSSPQDLSDNSDLWRSPRWRPVVFAQRNQWTRPARLEASASACKFCVCLHIYSNISNSATTRRFPGFASSMIGKNIKIISKLVVKNDDFPWYTPQN